MTKSIAVIGQGFVGGSLATVFSERGVDPFVYDISGKVASGGIDILQKMMIQDRSLRLFVSACENSAGGIFTRFSEFSGIYFVCLPTPMREDGSCDVSIVEGVLDELSTIGGSRIAVIKSTVPPGTTSGWNKKYEATGLRVIFNPEFLTEANALDDMRNQNRIVLGGPRPHINKVKQIFQTAFPKVPLIKTSSTTAEMVKYLTNNFLTVKVAFANEMSQVCEALDKNGLDIDYDKVVEYATYDTRLGDSHWSVPGPDGKRGFSGSCFPKDLNSMIFTAKSLDIRPLLLEAAWQKNLEVRPGRDWEYLVGRAVVKKAK
jgi:UDPglucose 6-dehydrogenase